MGQRKFEKFLTQTEIQFNSETYQHSIAKYSIIERAFINRDFKLASSPLVFFIFYSSACE